MTLNFLKTNIKIIFEMFDRTLGKYTSSVYTIELKENAKPYHAKPFPIPKPYK